MCITELWTNNMKNDLIKIHQCHAKQAINMRMHGADKEYMSVYKPDYQRNSFNIYRQAIDDSLNMKLSAFKKENYVNNLGMKEQFTG